MAEVQGQNLPKTYPMKGGDGDHSYAKNSTSQREAIDAVKEFIKEAIAVNFDIDMLSWTNTFRIADMGCSVGPNTFAAVQNILEALQNKHQSQGLDSRSLEFQVFLNDHAFNDFNTLFTSLPPNRQYYAVGVPGSFHGRLFPNSSLHIVHSSIALQWLSQVPEEVGDKNSPAWNKGRIFYTSAGNETVKAYEDQFAKDMDSFLHSRAQEVASGGLIVLLVPGRLNETPHSQAFCNITWDILGSCLIDMAKKGSVSEDKVDSFNLPLYFTSPREIEDAVERNGCFSIERLEIILQKNTQKDVTLKARLASSHFRAGQEAVLKEHFGHEIMDEQLMDELFNSFTKKLEEHTTYLSGSGFILFLVLKRKATD